VIGNAGSPMGEGAADALLAAANGLPQGDVFVVQRDRTRGVFPPIGRPAVTSVSVTPQEIVIVSRGGRASGPLATSGRPDPFQTKTLANEQIALFPPESPLPANSSKVYCSA